MTVGAANYSVFVSHKARDSAVVTRLLDTLSEVEHVEFWWSGKIAKGDKWREAIYEKVKVCDFFILLYTDPLDDWSWCLYEAGLFDATRRQSGLEVSRRLYCVHHSEIKPPDTLSEFQTVKATSEDIQHWLNDFYKDTQQQEAFISISATASQIHNLLSSYLPVMETIPLKPYIHIRPIWPAEGARENDARPKWRPANVPDELPLRDSMVQFPDSGSPVQLGFASPPDNLTLSEFFSIIDCDGGDIQRFWLERFLASLQRALKGLLGDQDVTYFRHKSGKLLRPIIDGVSFAKDGSDCFCRVVFVEAFSAPPSGYPPRLQVLANGIRLCARTQLEVIGRFRNKLAMLASETVPEDSGQLQSYSVGSQVIESLNVIVQEARAHGSRLEDEASELFNSKEKQAEYVAIRNQFKALHPKLIAAAKEEDRETTSTYCRTEAALSELENLMRRYMEISVPELEALFANDRS